MISQEELDDLKASPAGRALWAYLGRRVSGLMEQWAEGRFNSENQAVCTQANISAVTELKAFEQILEIDAKEINEDESGQQLGI